MWSPKAGSELEQFLKFTTAATLPGQCWSGQLWLRSFGYKRISRMLLLPLSRNCAALFPAFQRHDVEFIISMLNEEWLRKVLVMSAYIVSVHIIFWLTASLPQRNAIGSVTMWPCYHATMMHRERIDVYTRFLKGASGGKQHFNFNQKYHVRSTKRVTVSTSAFTYMILV